MFPAGHFLPYIQQYTTLTPLLGEGNANKKKQNCEQRGDFSPSS